MPQSFRVASVAEVPAGSSCEVVAGDRVLALFNVEGTFFALDGVCPHAGGPLAQGRIINGLLTCPWHGWQFELSSGKNCLNPRISAGCYQVSISGDDVFVEVPD